MSTIKGIEEKILIDRFIEGDKTAFELIFRFYYQGLVIFTKQIVLDIEEAEEIVQDFFVQIWIARKKIKKTSSLKNYFFISVKNRALNFLKKARVEEQTLSELKRLIESDMLYNPDLFVISELQEKIKKAFAKLPPRTREIFQLSRNQGFSNDEIASKLNLSKRTIETQISNALKILRIELKGYQFLLLIIGISDF